MTKSDAEAITDTILDYFEGWFDGDTARMERALHPELAKRRAGKELGITTKARMVELTGQGDGAEDRGDGRVDVTSTRSTRTSPAHRPHGDLPRVPASRPHAEGWQIANALWRPRDQDRRALGRRGGAARRAPSGCSSRSGTPASPPAGSPRRPGVNHGLVHYYFGSMEKLLVARARALHRAADRAPARAVRRRRPVHREVAHGDALPRRATTRRYQKIWLELQALAWNDAELRERLARVNARVARGADRGVRRAARASSGSTMPLERARRRSS